ncbi:MAG: DUF481 domain-containing protein, partial [Wenzhouxiangellaceae bacterium]
MPRVLLPVLLLMTSLAHADELYLADGSRLVGNVSGVTSERVILETEYAGTLEVLRSAIRGLVTDGATRVVLDSGERVIGRLQWNEQGGQRLRGDLIDTIALDPARIVALEDPATPVAEQVLADAEADRADAVWSSEISLAVSGASGNTDEFTATPRFTALRETEFDRLKLGLQGRFARQDGRETENEVIANASLERDFSERWFGLGALRLERDELENLDLRVNLDFGVGYFMIQEDHHEFKPRIGIGFQSESFTDDGTTENIVGVAGWDYRYDVNSRWRFTHVLDYRPTFTDPAGE